jgi:hypothetical protein
MKKELKKISSSIVLGFLFMITSYAQGLYNNGGYVIADAGSFIHVDGNVENSASALLEVAAIGANVGELIVKNNFVNNATAGGNGNFRVEGNWTNNSIFNAGTGTVHLEGGAQQIAGTASTTFYNLVLAGTASKTLGINQTVSNVLNLNDRELNTQQYTVFVTNPATNAILRTTGFVSSALNGFLSRNTNSTNTYLFPVGSSVGTPRYRPVEIQPVAGSNATFTVRLANVNATIEGFDVSQFGTAIEEVNDNFYHRINRTSGTTAANMNIFFHETLDGDFGGVSGWDNSMWDTLQGSFSTTASPLSYARVENWNDFSQNAYILHKLRERFDFSGRVLYAGSISITPITPPVYNSPAYVLQNVEVALENMLGDTVDVQMTNASGEFFFNDVIQGDYVVRYGKDNDDYFRWIKSQQGIDVTDLTLLLFHIADPTNPNLVFDLPYYQAVDVNENGVVDVVDRAQINAKIMDPYNAANISSPNYFTPGNWLNLSEPITIDTDIVNHEGILIATGDYNGSASGYMDDTNPYTIINWSGAKQNNYVNLVVESSQVLPVNQSVFQFLLMWQLTYSIFDHTR